MLVGISDCTQDLARDSVLDISGIPYDPSKMPQRWHFHDNIVFMYARAWRVVGARLASSLSVRLLDQRSLLRSLPVGAHLARELLGRLVVY